MDILVPRDKKLIEQLRDLPMAQISILGVNTLPEGSDIFFKYLSSDLSKDFIPALGKAHCQVEGKYRKASMYFFEYGGERFACAIEKGDRGTSWHWLLDDDNKKHYKYRMLFLDQPPLDGVFPDFLSVLHEQVYQERFPINIFSSSVRNRIERRWATEQNATITKTVDDQLHTAPTSKRHKI